MKTSHSMARSVGHFKIQKPHMTGVLQKWLFYKTVLKYTDSLPSHCSFAKRWNCLFQLYNTSQWTLFKFSPIQPYSIKPILVSSGMGKRRVVKYDNPPLHPPLFVSPELYEKLLCNWIVKVNCKQEFAINFDLKVIHS